MEAYRLYSSVPSNEWVDTGYLNDNNIDYRVITLTGPNNFVINKYLRLYCQQTSIYKTRRTCEPVTSNILSWNILGIILEQYFKSTIYYFSFA